MPPAMQALTALSPMAWSLEGFWDMVLRNAAWQDVLNEAFALLLFGLLSLFLASVIYQKKQNDY
jgi:ABC-2 type transport system permease protein